MAVRMLPGVEQVVRAHAWSRARMPAWLPGLLVALAATGPSWWPWMSPRFDFWALDDGGGHLLRIYHLGWLVQHGAWYPRWVPDMALGFGYPLFNYYAPGFYYVVLALQGALGLDVWDGYRVAGLLAILAGSAGAYTLASSVWQRPSLGVLASVTLIYAPYAFQANLWKRGALPEVAGLAALPWLLWAIWGAWWSSDRHCLRWIALLTGAGVVEVLMHNVAALLGAGVATVWLAYLTVVAPSRAAFTRVLGAGALVAGLTAFFWAPAMFERAAVQGEWLTSAGTDYRQWLVEVAGPAGRQTAGLVDLHLHYPQQLSEAPKASLVQVALAAVVAAGLLSRLVQRFGQPDERTLRHGKLAAQRRATWWVPVPLGLVAGALWLLTLRPSEVVWRAVPGMASLQFPWRLMGPFAICLAMAGAGALSPAFEWLERRSGGGRWPARCLVALLGAAVLVNGLGNRDLPLRATVAHRIVDAQAVRDDEVRNEYGLGTTTRREFLPQAVQIATYTAGAPRGLGVFEQLYPEADWRGGLFYPVSGGIRLLNWQRDPLRLVARVANDGQTGAILGIHQFAFPGWRAWIDRAPAALNTAPYVPEQQAALGFLVLEVPPGEHEVSLAFGPTPLRAAVLGLSLLTGVAVATAAVWRHRYAPSRVVLAGAWLVLSTSSAVTFWSDVSRASPPDGSLGVEPTSALVANVAEMVRAGDGALMSPSGAELGPNYYLDVRPLAITEQDSSLGLAATAERDWLYMHPPSDVSVRLLLPPRRRAVFVADLGQDPDVWAADEGDGVRFQAYISAGGARAPVLVIDRALNARANQADRRWVPVKADLSEWSGQAVTLTLRTQPNDSAAYDWAGWGDPVVVFGETARGA